MEDIRAYGILLHPTSLPGPWGIGDLGQEATAFLDWLHRARARFWQVLPLCATGMGDNPYLSVSAFAGNPALIDPDQLTSRGWLAEPEPPSFAADRVEYGRMLPGKHRLLRAAHAGFAQRARPDQREDLELFCLQEASWLDDYALFMALGDRLGHGQWRRWPEPLRRRDPGALAEAARSLEDEVRFQQWTQWVFLDQLQRLRSQARERGVRIIGDIPIFVSLDSADVWAHQEYFHLDHDGNPTVVGGVPPDYFSTTGQRWGNPLYRWEVLEQEEFGWWIERIRSVLRTCDWIRIDHFRGVQACWEIPAEEPTAVRGRWVTAPGERLFGAVRQALGDVPIIAEDLGVITDEVRALRDRLGFPGMKVLQFAFGGDEHNPFLPHNFPQDGACVVYPGTHDNDTCLGWYRTLGKPDRGFLKDYLAKSDIGLRRPADVPWALIRLAMQSRARLAVIPVQDVLALGSEARMNLPASATGNWAWRLGPDLLTDRLTRRLHRLATATQRI